MNAPATDAERAVMEKIAAEFGLDLDGTLNKSQCGLIAASMVNVEHGQTARYNKDLTVSDRAAELLGINRGTLFDARLVLRHGTDDEIKAVAEGRSTTYLLAMQMRKKVPASKRVLSGRDSPDVVAGNKVNAELVRMRSQVWRHLRDALENFTSLPRPIDAVPIARMMDRKRYITPERLALTIDWLKEFAHEWSKRYEAADKDADNADNDDHAGNGDRAA